MRAFRLLLVITLLALPSISVWAQNTNDISIAQLKEQIQKLEAIERDGTISAEVRELNRAFLKRRRIHLQAQLQKTVDGLQSYLKELGNSLRPEEKSIVQNTIEQAEEELRNLKEGTEARVNNESPGLPSDSTANANTTTTPFTSNIVGGSNGNGNGNGNGLSVPAVNATSAPVVTSITQPAQPQGKSLNDVINERIQAKAESRVEQTDNTNQTDVPSASSTSGSLVDQSSASDLIGLATNLAGLSASTNDDQPDPSSLAVTASAYSLLAAIKRVDPLNTDFYNHHRNWRKLSFTLGYDDEDLPDGTKQRTKLFGAKFMFIDRRDPGLTERNGEYIKAIGENLRTATAAFGDLSVRVRAFVFNLDSVRTNIFIPGFQAFLERRKTQVQQRLERERNTLTTEKIAEANATLQRIDQLLKNPGDEKLFVGRNFLPTSTWSDEEKLYRSEFLNEYLGTDYRQKLGDDIANAIDEFIDQQLTDGELIAFKNLNSSARTALEDIRRAPQLSLAFTTKQRRIGIDEYLGTLIFDYGVADRINLTLNGSYNYNDSKLIGADIRGFKFAGQLRFQLNQENLLGKKPLFFDISTQGSWMNNVDAIYKAQGKLTIPIADGIDFPISVTWANRTTLIDEKEVRGQFGFTLDTARLIRAFLFR